MSIRIGILELMFILIISRWPVGARQWEEKKNKTIKPRDIATLSRFI